MPSSAHRRLSHSMASPFAVLESLPSNLKALAFPAPRHPVRASTCWRDHSCVIKGLLKTTSAQPAGDALAAMLGFNGFGGVIDCPATTWCCGFGVEAMRDLAFGVVFCMTLRFEAGFSS